MRKRWGLMIAGTLLLGACGGADDETTDPATEEVTDMDEEVETETEDMAEEMETDTDTEESEGDSETTDDGMDSDNAEDDMETETDAAEEDTEMSSEPTEDEANTDEAVDLSAIMDQDFEEINWDDVHLTRSEFDASLTELQRSFNEDYEEEEDMDVRINNVDFSGDTIEITLTNDDSEYADMTNNFLAAFLDSFYRQLYLQSDYSDGNTHPRIIIQTSDGEVITDQTDFMEYDIQEEMMDSAE
ncbi:hypothetical protein SAMN04488100_12530 [Alkalibacterium putridalgicola]|uniref:Uncharacterized protein n=1 Tax=Alkalibacterium putridalgicola TaxID=426703 RepID=A0A1H7VMK4_9LACT|nr:hypothetical protein [Alkalibacterium putridalgicola]GEK89422.1 hypothetical protein APU01nite_14610 [Alkalibacterium putridalgicola]SEM10027.1 hypothetical protein SAMN04488100_12530 [Alkalibacterium putridalgicola]